MKIQVTNDHAAWPVGGVIAVDEDTYDPESRNAPRGMGRTRDAAIADLAEQFEGEWSDEQIIAAHHAAVAANDADTLFFLDCLRSSDDQEWGE